MASTALVPAKNVSRSKQSVRRSVEGKTEEVVILQGRTFTAAFDKVAAVLTGIATRRPNRCRPIHQDVAGSESEWADIASEAPSSDQIRAIAKYLRETGQDAT